MLGERNLPGTTRVIHIYTEFNNYIEHVQLELNSKFLLA